MIFLVCIANLLLSSRACAEDVFLIDRILCTVSLGQDVEVITQSDLDRLSLDGASRTLEQLKFERAMYLEAKKMGMVPDDQALQQGRAQLEKENGLSRAQFDQLFLEIGYTAKEGMEELRHMQAINAILDFKVRSQLMVPRSEIEKFYQENPEMVSASYELEQALIPFSSTKSKQEQQALVDAYIAGTYRSKKVKWSPSFSIEHDDVAQGMRFVYALPEGGIGSVETEDGFLLLKVVAKHPGRERSLEERYEAIADQLRRPRYQQLMDEYKKELFAVVNVVELQSPH